MNVRPGKNQIQQQPPQQQPQPNYNPRSNAPQQYNLHPYDHQDGPQKFAYGSPYVSGAGAGQPPRMPLVTGIPGSTQSLPGTPNASLGGMPQGPPPTTYVSHGPVDLSKQTPPHHQGQHHPLPPGSLGVNQQIMANPGHAGPMQGRQAQGNNQYFQRNPNIRPGSQPMRPPMHGGGASMNASHPPNAQAMPYPTQSPIINQPLLFVLNDQYNNQTQMYSYTNPANYYQPGNMVPPGSVQYQAQPRASTPTPYGYRPAGSYQYQMQASQTVYFPQQPQQPQQQQQAQQIQQQQPQQQAQQQPQQQIVSSAVTTPQSAQSQPQPRESGSSSSGRKTRSSALRIVDPDDPKKF